MLQPQLRVSLLAFPSRKPWLPESFADIQKEGVIQLPARFLHPEVP
jgi:hypothetical protein